MRFAIALVVLALGVTLGACGPSRSLSPEETAPVRVGVVLSRTGDIGGPGQQRLDAVRLAAREVNAAGGVLPGRRVELVIGDGESDPDIAVQVARDIVASGIVALVGESGSSSTLAIYQAVTQPAGIPHASGSSTSTAISDLQSMLSDSDRWFFRTAPSDVAQAPVLGGAMFDRGCRRVVVVHVDNDYGVPFADALEARFAGELGGTIVDRIAITDGLADYSVQAMEIATADTPDCVALIAYPGSGGRLMRGWSAIVTRPTLRFFGTDALRQTTFVEEAGGSANVDGFLGTAPITDPSTPAYNDFAALYRSTWGREPSTYDANFYDATALILLAIARAGSTDRSDVRDAIVTLSDPLGVIVRATDLANGLRRVRDGTPINYEGASGPVNVDALGEVAGVYEVWRYVAASDAFEQQEIITP